MLNEVTSASFPVFNRENLPDPEYDYQEGAVFLVNKPFGFTSFRVVGLIRKLTQIKKVGHAGTLDPNATGLLIICTGKATKSIESLIGGTKRYVAEITLGGRTKSFDKETEIEATAPFDHISREQLETIISEQFIGSIQQVPPMYSAVKFKGTPLYKLARKGKVVERKSRTVTILRNELLQFSPPLVKLNIHCTKGTYIRSLAHDLGLALGSYAYLSGLIRTFSEPFELNDAMSIETLLKSLDPHGESGISF